LASLAVENPDPNRQERQDPPRDIWRVLAPLAVGIRIRPEYSVAPRAWYLRRVARFEDLPRVSDSLTPAERLRVAFELSDAAIVLVRARLRRQHPDATEADLDARVEAWLTERPGAEGGDAVGRPSARFGHLSR